MSGLIIVPVDWVHEAGSRTFPTESSLLYVAITEYMTAKVDSYQGSKQLIH